MLFLVFLAVLLTTFPVWSQNSDETTPRPEPVVVTVSAEAVPLSDTSASVLIFSREYLDATRAQNVAEVLSEVPFLHLSRAGARGGLTTVTVRGGDPNFTLVLIDGVPVNDSTNLLGGSYDFSLLSLDNVERIEIVRGPLSSVYGSEAVSGVINIISRRGGRDFHFESEGGVGNFDSRNARVSADGRSGAVRFSLSGSYQEAGEQVERERFRLGTVAVASDVTFSPGTILQFTSRYNDAHAAGFPDNGGGPEFSVLRDLKESDAQELLFSTQLLHEWSAASNSALQFDVYQRDQLLDVPAILDGIPPGETTQPPIVSDSSLERYRLHLIQNWTKNELSFSFGGGWKAESGKNRGLIADTFPSAFDLNRDTAFFHTEVRYQSPKWDANAAIRADKSQRFDAELSPSFGIAYTISNKARVRGTWGEGYKLPSFFALGDPNIGNNSLQPEKSHGWDAGVDYSFSSKGPHVSLIYFFNSYKDLIDFSPELFQLVNRTLVTTRGVEVSSSVKPVTDIHINAHLTFVDAEIENTEEVLRDRPRWRGGFQTSWNASNQTRVSAGILWVGDRFDFQIPVPQLQVAESYHVVNFAASHDIIPSITAFVRVENLLDNRYQQFVGFNDPGRMMRFGLIYRVNK